MANVGAARGFGQSGQKAEALNACRLAIQVNGYKGETFHDVGHIYARLEQYDEAILSLKTEMLSLPSDAPVTSIPKTLGRTTASVTYKPTWAALKSPDPRFIALVGQADDNYSADTAPSE